MPERRRASYDPAGSLHRIGDSSSDLSGSQGLDDRQAEQAKEAQKLNQIVQVPSTLFLACHRDG
jgi:hypothetical protein